MSRSSRRREFSDVRSYLNSSHGNFHASQEAKAEIAKPTQPKPGKWIIDREKRNRNSKQNVSGFNKSMTFEVGSGIGNKESAKQGEEGGCHSTREVCVNCVNKIAVDKKTKGRIEREKKDREDQNLCFEKMRTSVEGVQNMETVRGKQKQVISYTNRIQRGKMHELKEKQVEAKEMKELEADFRKEHERHVNQQLQKKQRFNEQLKQQIEERKNKRKAEEELEKRRCFNESYEDIPLPVDRKESAQIEYRRGLETQIREKKQRAKKQKEDEIELNARNQKLTQPLHPSNPQNPRDNPTPRTPTSKQYAEILKTQMQSKKQQREKRQQEQIHHQQKHLQQTQMQFLQTLQNQKLTKQRAISTYLMELRTQIQRKQQQNISQKLSSREPFLTLTGQIREEKLIDCENCHHRFPKKFLSKVQIE